MKRLVIFFSIVLIAANATADDTPIVNIEITPEQVIVGESIRMRVTVLGPTWFPKPPEYPSFEIPNAVVRLPANSSRPVSQQVGGDTWSGIVRNYEIIPLIGARYQLADQSMQIAYANPEDVSNPIVVDVSVPPIEFVASVPAGAEALDPYIAGSNLTLVREIEGESDGLEVGDALVVTYTAELDGLPSMFLPDILSVTATPGVSAYADRPTFNDDQLATRSEKLTYVFEAGGDYEIPAASLSWWNLESETIETASVPAMTITVTGPPLSAAPGREDGADLNPWRIAGLGVLAIAALVLLRRIAGVVSVRRQAREKRRLASEAYAFEQLNHAIRSRDLHTIYQRLLVWLERLQGNTDAMGFSARYGDIDLRNQVTQLSSILFAEGSDDLDVHALAKGLGKARERFLDEARLQAQTALPSLNP